MAVAVQPLRLWLEARVRHLVHGPGADPGHVVRRLGSQLGREGTVDALLVDMAEDLGRSMRLDSVVVHGAQGPPLAEWGTCRAEPHVVPLRHRGVEIGRLEVTAPPWARCWARAASGPCWS